MTGLPAAESDVCSNSRSGKTCSSLINLSKMSSVHLCSQSALGVTLSSCQIIFTHATQTNSNVPMSSPTGTFGIKWIMWRHVNTDYWSISVFFFSDRPKNYFGNCVWYIHNGTKIKSIFTIYDGKSSKLAALGGCQFLKQNLGSKTFQDLPSFTLLSQSQTEF